MKTCPACRIKVGGEFRQCPLCQNELLGEDGEIYFPKMDKLKQLSLIYKIQLFAVFVAGVAAITLDCIVGLNNGVHWSILTTISIIVGEIIAWRLIRKRSGIYYYIANITTGVILLMLPAAWLFGFRQINYEYILPSLFLAAIGSLFAFTLIDKKDNVLPYLLSFIFFGALPGIVLMIRQKEIPLLWYIALIAGVTALVGTIIFKGGQVFSEIEKRLHM